MAGDCKMLGYGQKASVCQPEVRQQWRPISWVGGRRHSPGRNLGAPYLLDSRRLLAIAQRWPRLGRRWTPDQAGIAAASWPVAHLVRPWSDATVLSAAPQPLLGRTSALGRCGARLSPHQRSLARTGGLSVGGRPDASGGEGCVAGRFHFCAASGVRGDRGVDFRAEEHALGRVLFRRRPRLFAFRPDAGKESVPAGRRSSCLHC
jgi:hypothetical protein